MPSAVHAAPAGGAPAPAGGRSGQPARSGPKAKGLAFAGRAAGSRRAATVRRRRCGAGRMRPAEARPMAPVAVVKAKKALRASAMACLYVSVLGGRIQTGDPVFDARFARLT